MSYVPITTEEGGALPPLVSLDSMLESMHNGRFHWILLLLCGLSFMADAMEVTLLSYISFCAADEWHLSGAQTASLSSFVFLGITAGNIIFGYIADHKGRRPSYICGSAILVVGGFLTALAPNFETLLLLRCFVGVGVGSSPVPFDILAEFLPDATRGEFLLLIELFWTFGTLHVAGAAWLLLGRNGWRALVLAATLPVLLALCLSAYLLPESPRWLLSQGRAEEARAVVIEAFKMNRQTTPVFRLDREDGDTTERNTSHSNMDMFRVDNVKILLPLYFVWFVLGFGYYAYVLFLSKIFTTESTVNSSDIDSAQCSFEYGELFFSALFEVLGVLLGVYLLRWQFGRVTLQSCFYGLTALCVVGLGLVASSGAFASTLFASIGRLSIMISSCMTWVATPELFQTEHRSCGHSIAVAISRMGAFCAPYLVNSDSETIRSISMILALLLGSAALVVLTLPETAGHHTADFGKENI